MKCKNVLLLLVATITVAWASNANAQYIDITQPGDAIKVVSGTNDGDGNSGPPPAAEGVERAIDNVGQKYLNFLDLGSGFAVTPATTGKPVVGLRLFTANDAVERDPASYELAGSNVGLDGPWTVIATGPLSLPADRNPGGAVVPTKNELVTFANNASYGHYKLIFPTLKNAASANSMQIGEVELLAVPEPASATLASLAFLVLGAVARRKR